MIAALKKICTILGATVVLASCASYFVLYQKGYEYSRARAFCFSLKSVMEDSALLEANNTCMSLKDSLRTTWLKERYMDDVEVAWTAKNAKLSQRIEEWYLSMQGGKDKDYKKALNKLLTLIQPIDMVPSGNSTKPCLRCAVVGNSGNMKNSNYGQEIDQHQTVIRINKGPVESYEKDVGKKTTHRIEYPESHYTLTNETSLIFANFKVDDLNWLITKLEDQAKTKKISIIPNKVIILNPAFMWHIHYVWLVGVSEHKDGRWPSTGILAIFYALYTCDEVDVYGFGANKEGYWDHYWSTDNGQANSAFMKTGVHNSDSESVLIKKLNEQKVINFKRPP